MWAASLEDALAQAKETKRPVMISVLAGPEEDRAPFLKSLDDPKVKALSAKVICVAACEGQHAGGAADCKSAFDSRHEITFLQQVGLGQVRLGQGMMVLGCDVNVPFLDARQQ